MIRKLSVIALGLAFVFSVIGCGQSKEEVKSNVNVKTSEGKPDKKGKKSKQMEAALEEVK